MRVLFPLLSYSLPLLEISRRKGNGSRRGSLFDRQCYRFSGFWDTETFWLPVRGTLRTVQVIFKFLGSPEDYIAELAHRAVPAPQACCRCAAKHRLESLGYYSRGLSSLVAMAVLSIFIRRFRCHRCGGTVSFLPSFAQPYRLVRNETVQQFFEGSLDDLAVQRWEYLLRRYAKRFRAWFPLLLVITGRHSGRPPPIGDLATAWAQFSVLWGDLSRATNHLVANFHVTAFGSYRCHQPPEK